VEKEEGRMCARIACDIDDTLYSFTDEAREVLSLMVDEPELAEYHERLSHALYAKWDQWRTPFELCGVDADGNSLWIEVIRRCHDDEAILRQQPFNGAVEVLNELADAGHALTYVSNRATETEDATHQWLMIKGFPAGELVVTDGNKAPFIRDCEYMIDDRVKNVLEFIYDFEYETQRRIKFGVDSDRCKRKAFVRVADYNGGLTDVPNLYLAHTWAGLRRYMVKTGLLLDRVFSYA
jgi:hypothetical protein